MLLPNDYGEEALFSSTKRKLMQKIEFEHGGKEFDDKYPEGIPTAVEITNRKGDVFDTGLVMFPGGHAANEDVSLTNILQYKFLKMGQIALEKEEL